VDEEAEEEEESSDEETPKPTLAKAFC